MNKGGFYSIPKLTFPGGMLIGCSAGFLNPVKVKGTHNAMKTGMIAAETIFDQTVLNEGQELKNYEKNVKDSWVFKDMKRARNFKGSFKNLYSGLIY